MLAHSSCDTTHINQSDVWTLYLNDITKEFTLDIIHLRTWYKTILSRLEIISEFYRKFYSFRSDRAVVCNLKFQRNLILDYFHLIFVKNNRDSIIHSDFIQKTLILAWPNFWGGFWADVNLRKYDENIDKLIVNFTILILPGKNCIKSENRKDLNFEFYWDDKLWMIWWIPSWSDARFSKFEFEVLCQKIE